MQNAVKYSKANSKIEITLAYVQRNEWNPEDSLQ